jgi:hypothetical protein
VEVEVLKLAFVADSAVDEAKVAVSLVEALVQVRPELSAKRPSVEIYGILVAVNEDMIWLVVEAVVEVMAVVEAKVRVA